MFLGTPRTFVTCDSVQSCCPTFWGVPDSTKVVVVSVRPWFAHPPPRSLLQPSEFHLAPCILSRNVQLMKLESGGLLEAYGRDLIRTPPPLKYPRGRWFERLVLTSSAINLALLQTFHGRRPKHRHRIALSDDQLS